jgi:hypothetical protein
MFSALLDCLFIAAALGVALIMELATQLLVTVRHLKNLALSLLE